MTSAIPWLGGVQGGANPSFDLPLQTTLVPNSSSGSATPTFTRATTAYVQDFEGLLKPVLSGEARMRGSRRVRNRLGFTEALTNGYWVTVTMTVTAGISDPRGGTAAATMTATGANSLFYKSVGSGVSGNSYKNSMFLRRRTGTGAIKLIDINNGSYETVTLTTSWQRFATSDKVANATNQYFGLQIVTSGDEVDLAFPQQEEYTGQSNTNPSEYVSVDVLSAPFHGLGVDGVKAFGTLNGNTVV